MNETYVFNIILLYNSLILECFKWEEEFKNIVLSIEYKIHVVTYFYEPGGCLQLIHL